MFLPQDRNLTKEEMLSQAEEIHQIKSLRKYQVLKNYKVRIDVHDVVRSLIVQEIVNTKTLHVMDATCQVIFKVFVRKH